jgi:hypothetical protein
MAVDALTYTLHLLDMDGRLASWTRLSNDTADDLSYGRKVNTPEAKRREP